MFGFGKKRYAPRRSVSDAEWEELQRAAVVDWRKAGPYDISEVDLDDQVPRQNWGALIVTPWRGLEVQANGASDTDIESLTFHWQGLAMEVVLFADGKSPILYPQMLEKMQEYVTSLGGSLVELEGPLGTEIHIAIMLEKDRFQQVRLISVHGPGWLLRAALLDEAALLPDDDVRIQRLLAGFKALCVVRGNQALVPGRIIALTHFAKTEENR